MLTHELCKLFDQVSFVWKRSNPRDIAVREKVYLDILEEFLMPILDEEDPDDILFHTS